MTITPVDQSLAPTPRDPRGGARARRRKQAIPSDEQCHREGCNTPKPSRHDYCSMLCKLADEELIRVESLCRSAGPGQQTGELWSRAVVFADALTSLRAQARHVAVGIANNAFDTET